MRLNNYIKFLEKTIPQAAREMNVPYVTLKRYCDGIRIPKPIFMQKIVVWSKGQVMPNDFYDKE